MKDAQITDLALLTLRMENSVAWPYLIGTLKKAVPASEAYKLRMRVWAERVRLQDNPPAPDAPAPSAPVPEADPVVEQFDESIPKPAAPPPPPGPPKVGVGPGNSHWGLQNLAHGGGRQGFDGVPGRRR